MLPVTVIVQMGTSTHQAGHTSTRTMTELGGLVRASPRTCPGVCSHFGSGVCSHFGSEESTAILAQEPAAILAQESAAILAQQPFDGVTMVVSVPVEIMLANGGDWSGPVPGHTPPQNAQDTSTTAKIQAINDYLQTGQTLIGADGFVDYLCPSQAMQLSQSCTIGAFRPHALQLCICESPQPETLQPRFVDRSQYETLQPSIVDEDTRPLLSIDRNRLWYALRNGCLRTIHTSISHIDAGPGAETDSCGHLLACESPSAEGGVGSRACPEIPPDSTGATPPVARSNLYVSEVKPLVLFPRSNLDVPEVKPLVLFQRSNLYVSPTPPSTHIDAGDRSGPVPGHAPHDLMASGGPSQDTWAYYYDGGDQSGPVSGHAHHRFAQEPVVHIPEPQTPIVQLAPVATTTVTKDTIGDILQNRLDHIQRQMLLSRAWQEVYMDIGDAVCPAASHAQYIRRWHERRPLQPRIVESIVDDGSSNASDDAIDHFRYDWVQVGNSPTSFQDSSLDADDVTLFNTGFIEDKNDSQPIACADACEGTIVEGTQHDNPDNTHNNYRDSMVGETVKERAQVSMVQTRQRIVEVPQIESVDHRAHMPVHKHHHGPMVTVPQMIAHVPRPRARRVEVVCGGDRSGTVPGHVPPQYEHRGVQHPDNSGHRSRSVPGYAPGYEAI
jgi:hypothetical protein